MLNFFQANPKKVVDNILNMVYYVVVFKKS